MTSYKWLSILFVLLFASCQPSEIYRVGPETPLKPSLSASSPVYAPLVYPYWFLEPHKLDLTFPTAVGYAATGYQRNKALERAIEDGIEKMTKFIQIRLYVDQLSMDEQIGQLVEEEIDASIKENIKEKYKILATYEGKELTLVLIGLEARPKLPNNLTTVSSTPPGWLKKLPSKAGYTYARGQSIMGYRPQNAWTRAEHYARINLAFSMYSQVAVLERFDQEKLKGIIQIRTDVMLNRVEMVARWYNAKNRNCYVLVRVPITAN